MAGTITVFGGTGFIGRHLVALLLRTGKTVRMAVRYPGRVQMATKATNSPDIVQADMLDDASVGSAIMGADAVFNLAGILTETSTQTCSQLTGPSSVFKHVTARRVLEREMRGAAHCRGRP